MRAAPAALLVLALAASAAADPPTATVEVTGTSLRIGLPDGSVLTGAALVGVVVVADDESGRTASFRIDAVEPDPDDPSGQVQLYTVASPDAAGTWRNPCAAGPDGRRQAFPLAGVWTPAGGHRAVPGRFQITCTSGAIGKCVRLGYRPWTLGPDGQPMRDLHQACVRMIRADYCGDGASFTRDGTTIDLWDRLGINRPEVDPGAMTFEAAWDVHGALCVAHPRHPDLITLDALTRRCPARLAGRTGAACTPDTTIVRGAVLGNRS